MLEKVLTLSCTLARSMKALYSQNEYKGFGEEWVTRKEWKPEEVQILRELYKTTSINELARRLDRTYSSVLRKAQYMGLRQRTRKPRPFTEDEIEKIVALKERGATVRYIAKQLNRTFSSVSWKITDLGLRHKTPELSKVLAKKWFEKQGIEVVEEGGSIDAQDFIIKMKGKQIAVNVKAGEAMSVTLRNLRRLEKLGMKYGFLYITEDKIYFFGQPEVFIND